MDKNSVIGILLVGAIIITFSILNKPSEDEIARNRMLRDSLEMVSQQRKIKEQIEENNSPTNEVEIAPQKEPEEIDEASLEKRYGSFANAAIGEQAFYTLENDLIKLKISKRGGRPYSVELKEYKTYDSLPLILFDGDSSIFGFEFFANNRSIFTNNLFFTSVNQKINSYAKDKNRTLKLRLSASEKSYIEYVYTIKPNNHLIDFNINFVGMDNIIASNTTYLDLNWKIYAPQQEKGAVNESNYSTIGYKFQDEEYDELSSMRKDKDSKEINTKLNWVAFKQQFFSSIIVADNNFSNASIEQTNLEDSEKYIKLFTAKLGVQYVPGSVQSIPLQFYFGPNRYNTMRKYEKDFEMLVPLGKSIIKTVNRYIIIPVFNFLEKYIESYGLIILLLTIFIKIIIFPLTYKSYSSGAKMRVLKPQIDEIGKKFPKSEDSMKKQQATMGLYKKVGISPLGGCLPMVIQFPVLIAMFRFFPSSFELRQESFLWAEDLSSYDSIFTLPFTVPFGYGDHVSLFTLLMTVSTIIYTKLNNQMSVAANQQMPGMKMMMYFMPVMLLFWFNNYAAGLSYYYFLANVISFGQMAIIKRFVDEDAILKKLNERAADKKVVKKSSFQQRLEKMAKEKGYKK